MSSASGEKIPNYLVPSILCIFCCWPLAIVAIINAAKVDGLVRQGDIAGAREASATAKRWCWISFGLGLAGNLIVMIFYAILVAFAVTQQGNMPMK